MTPSLSRLKELRDRSLFSTSHLRDPNQVRLLQSSMDRCVLHKHCRVGGTQHPLGCCYPPHAEPMLRRCQLRCPHHLGPLRICGDSCFFDHLYRPYGCSRRRSINGVDFLVLRFCWWLPAICPLVSILATVVTLAFKLGATFLVRQGVLRLTLALGLALGLIELAVFRCVAGTSPHFGLSQKREMPGLRSSCRLKRFRDSHLRTLGFVVPTQSIGPKSSLHFENAKEVA